MRRTIEESLEDHYVNGLDDMITSEMHLEYIGTWGCTRSEELWRSSVMLPPLTLERKLHPFILILSDRVVEIPILEKEEETSLEDD